MPDIKTFKIAGIYYFELQGPKIRVIIISIIPLTRNIRILNYAKYTVISALRIKFRIYITTELFYMRITMSIHNLGKVWTTWRLPHLLPLAR